MIGYECPECHKVLHSVESYDKHMAEAHPPKPEEKKEEGK